MRIDFLHLLWKGLLTMSEELEINLSELFTIIKRRIKLVIIVTIFCIIISALATIFLIDKKYQSTARVLPKPQVTDGLVDYTQINANNSLVKNYVELIKGSTVLDQVDANLGLNSGFASSVISVSNQTNTQIITVSARTTNPELSQKVVEEAVNVFIVQIRDTLGIENIAIVDSAKVATSAVSPSLKLNLVIGTVIGLFISLGYIFINFILDTRIHNKEEAENYLGIPVLGIVPDFEK